MQFLEKDLEQIIFDTDYSTLSDRGLYMSGKKKRQLCIGNYGVADLVTFSRNPLITGGGLDITVFELKQDTIGIKAMIQAYRYCKGIKDYLKNIRNFKFHLSFSVVLIGKNIDMSDFCYLTDFINDFQVVTYRYEIDGLKFEYHNGFTLKNNGFKRHKRSTLTSIDRMILGI